MSFQVLLGLGVTRRDSMAYDLSSAMTSDSLGWKGAGHRPTSPVSCMVLDYRCSCIHLYKYPLPFLVCSFVFPTQPVSSTIHFPSDSKPRFVLHPFYTMQFTSASLFALLFAVSITSAAPLSLDARDVYAPPVSYPHTGTVWKVGATHNVTWYAPPSLFPLIL